jgi:Mce-associated membrane protein
VPPQRPHPARRRPRVAGRQHLTDRLGQLSAPGNSSGAITLDDPECPTEIVGAIEDLAPPPVRRFSRRWATALGLVGVLVIALGLAVWFHGEADQLRASAATSNRALLDFAATAQVTGQVRDAVERVFSYDFARLDDNERTAAAVITGPFAHDYREQFARVRELAPRQQAVVVASVPALAVKVLDGDRAIVVVFIDQQASRGTQAQPLLAAGRLSVIAQRVAGSWKIADVKPF